MAYDMRKIRDIMYDYSIKISENVMKCIIYTSKNEDYNDWLIDISNRFYDINTLTPKKGAIKPKDYIDNLFCGIGNELRDAEQELWRFHNFYVLNRVYPDFEITYDLYKTLFDAYWEIAKFFSNTIGKYEETIAKDKIIHDLHTILDKYC